MATDKKGSKLQEASQQQQFNRTVEDVELWLSEIEGQLMSEDYGKVCLDYCFSSCVHFVKTVGINTCFSAINLMLQISSLKF